MEVLLLSIFFCLQLSGSDSADLKEFYRVFSSDNMVEINSGINNLESARHFSQFNAYKGSLLMKKALLEKTADAKLNSFKSGYRLLEAEILKSPQNAEFRFLRLTIQEHAPDFLKYNKNLQEDRKIIKDGYRKLDSIVQDYILKYSLKSKVLTENDLQ